MASRRIVNLAIPSQNVTNVTQPEEAIEADRKLQNQKSNYLLLDARQKISDALDILFAKDSNLRNSAPTATPLVSKDTHSSKGLTDIKLGSIRLKSKVRLPSNRIVLN